MLPIHSMPFTALNHTPQRHHPALVENFMYLLGLAGLDCGELAVAVSTDTKRWRLVTIVVASESLADVLDTGSTIRSVDSCNITIVGVDTSEQLSRDSLEIVRSVM